MLPAGAARRLSIWLTLLFMIAAAERGPLQAQISTATVQGKVSDATGVLPGVTVTARETESGLHPRCGDGRRRPLHARRAAAGHLRDPDAMDQYKPQARTVQVLVGQTVTWTSRSARMSATRETVQVVSERLSDMRTTEVSRRTSPRSRFSTCRRTAATS